jgi:hypothetical protein
MTVDQRAASRSVSSYCVNDFGGTQGDDVPDREAARLIGAFREAVGVALAESSVGVRSCSTRSALPVTTSCSRVRGAKTTRAGVGGSCSALATAAGILFGLLGAGIVLVLSALALAALRVRRARAAKRRARSSHHESPIPK